MTVPLISARPPCASTGAAAPRMEQTASQTENRHRVRIEASLTACGLRRYWAGLPRVSTTNRAAPQEDLCNASRIGDVVEWIAVQYQKVRSLTGGEYAGVLQAQVVGAAARRRDNRLHRRHAGLHHQLQLAMLREAEGIVLQA